MARGALDVLQDDMWALKIRRMALGTHQVLESRREICMSFIDLTEQRSNYGKDDVVPDVPTSMEAS